MFQIPPASFNFLLFRHIPTLNYYNIFSFLQFPNQINKCFNKIILPSWFFFFLLLFSFHFYSYFMLLLTDFRLLWQNLYFGFQEFNLLFVEFYFRLILFSLLFYLFVLSCEGLVLLPEVLDLLSDFWDDFNLSLFDFVLFVEILERRFFSVFYWFRF